MFKNKVVVITGGTGSFGSTFCKSDHLKSAKEIRIFSRDEKKQNDLRGELDNRQNISYWIGDTRDYQSVENTFYGADYVFHAAALKQVPSCEFFPLEAVKTNILGSENVINASLKCHIKKTIILSTDKAVYPINAMGMTKALMEKCMLSKAMLDGKFAKTQFCATRYGNVMGSRGSVIPLFINQIKNKKPLTITNPEMTRFLMSLEESVNLVVHAFKNGSNGDIFIQKSPAATISTIAKALISIYKSSSKIQYIGTRHGEKAYESLVSSEEMVKVKSFKNFYKIPLDNRGLNYNKYFNKGSKKLSNISDYNSNNAERLDLNGVIKILKKQRFINV
jgi:UDP-glucose 4-epimerase|tara:strand:- start:1240 stop:2244 length:1005 start_codon:yes stop_codon:yes gene_type:complete